MTITKYSLRGSIATRNFNVPFVYGNIDLHNFKPHRKNPHIANVFSQTIMVEELGSGTKRIFKYTPLYANGQVPEIYEDDYFTIVIPTPFVLGDTNHDTINGGSDTNKGSSDTNHDTTNGDSDTINSGNDTKEDTINGESDTINGAINSENVTLNVGDGTIKGENVTLKRDDVIIVRIEFVKEYNLYDYCYCYYSLKVGQTGSMAPIRQMHEMKLNGNPISKGDDLIVTVGEGSLQSSIIVTSLSGAAIKEVPVIDGSAVISTSDLPVGLYVASQKGDVSAKFIVK